MQKLVVNGFTFPNNIKLRCSIAHFCKELTNDEYYGRSTGYSDGVWYDYWVYSVKNYYNNVTYEHNSRVYFSYYENKESATGKLWNLNKEHNRYLRNEFTYQVADMLPSFVKEKQDTTARNLANKAKRISKIFEPSKLIQPGDVVKLNRVVWDITNMAEVGYPDTYWRICAVPEQLFSSHALHYTSDILAVYINDIPINTGAVKNEAQMAALIKLIKAPYWQNVGDVMYVDKRCLIKA